MVEASVGRNMGINDGMLVPGRGMKIKKGSHGYKSVNMQRTFVANTSADRLLLTAPFSYDATQYVSNLSYEIQPLRAVWPKDAINVTFNNNKSLNST